MSIRTHGKIPFLNGTTGRLAVICGLVVAAVFLGSIVIMAGGGYDLYTLGVGFMAFAALAVLLCLTLEIPLIPLVRFAFIASFFFKGEANFFKVDELEDPSGFNISITLLTGLILLAHDLFAEKSVEKVFPVSFSILLAVLSFCAAVSVVYSGSTLLGWYSVWSLLTSILIAYVVASHFSQRERLIQLIIGVAIGVLFTGIVALSQYAFDFPTNLAFFGTGTEHESSGTQSEALSRVPAFLRTPNGMAWVMSTLVPLVIAPVICRVKSFTSPQRILLLAAGFAGAVAVILSLARGSWIGFFTALGLLVLFGWYRLSTFERRNYFVYASGAILLAGMLLTPFSDRIYERLTADDQGSASIRMPMMENAWSIIEENAFAGVGMNGYRTQMTKYDETGMFVSQAFPNPVHNVFAHITAEIGIPGGIAFCLLIVVALFECFKTMASHDRLLYALAFGAAIGMIAYVISGMKEPAALGSVRPPMRTGFLMLGTIMALSRMRRSTLI